MSMLRGEFQQFAGKMRQAAGAGGSEIEFAGLRLGQRHQLAHVLGRHVARHDEHFRHRDHQGDRREILQRLVRHLLHALVDRERAQIDDADGVAVGRGLGDGIGAERAARAAAIVDHDRLLGQLRHALADDAGDDVVGPAGRERHDQLDGFRREILRRGERRQQRERQHRQQPANHFHASPPEAAS